MDFEIEREALIVYIKDLYQYEESLQGSNKWQKLHVCVNSFLSWTV